MKLGLSCTLGQRRMSPIEALGLIFDERESLDSSLSFARNSIGTRINKNGILEIATTGAELVPNPAFDGVPDNTPVTSLPGWTVAYGSPTVAAIIGNQLTITANAPNQGARLDFATVAGRIYRIRLDVKQEAATTDIYVVSGTSTGFAAPVGNNRVFTFTAGASTATIYFRPNNNAGSGTCKLANISVQQASDAPRLNYDVNAIAGYGRNIVSSGTFDNDINGWSANSGLGSEAWNAGKLRRTSNGSSGGRFIDIPVTIGKRYKVGGDVALVSGTGAIGIWAYDGAGFATAVGNTNSNGNPFLTPANTSGFLRIYLYADGNTVADFDNISVSEAKYALKGILCEGSSTNLFNYSEDFTNAAYITNGFNVTRDQLAPDGSINACKITSVTGGQVTYRGFTATDTKVTVSLYAKAGTWSPAIGLRNNTTSTMVSSVTLNPNGTYGATGSTKVEAAPNGFYRITCSGTVAIGDSLSFYLGAQGSVPTGNYWIVYGAQWENALDSSTYIPTGALAVTRNVDVLTTSTINWFRSPIGTFYVEGDCRSVSSGSAIILTLASNLGASVNCTPQFDILPDGRVRAYFSGTGTDSISSTAKVVFGNKFKVAVTFDATSVSISVNGAVINGARTSVAAPTGFQIGCGGVSQALNGSVSRVRHFNWKMSNAELSALTTN